jgi:hypothetical protein
LNFIFVLISF